MVETDIIWAYPAPSNFCSIAFICPTLLSHYDDMSISKVLKGIHFQENEALRHNGLILCYFNIVRWFIVRGHIYDRHPYAS